jgi:hypothetical protein
LITLINLVGAGFKPALTKQSRYKTCLVFGMGVAVMIFKERTMAYIGKEEHAPVWLPESLPEEILVESSIELFHAEADGEAPRPAEPHLGFIVQDWFGPFLLSPPTRFLRGQC